MTLEELIDGLDSWDDSLTICAERSPDWNPNSKAELQPPEKVSTEGRFVYFLEVHIAKDVLDAWSSVRAGKVPNLTEKCEAIIHYAEYDAYLMPSDP